MSHPTRLQEFAGRSVDLSRRVTWRRAASPTNRNTLNGSFLGVRPFNALEDETSDFSPHSVLPHWSLSARPPDLILAQRAPTLAAPGRSRSACGPDHTVAAA